MLRNMLHFKHFEHLRCQIYKVLHTFNMLKSNKDNNIMGILLSVSESTMNVSSMGQIIKKKGKEQAFFWILFLTHLNIV